MHRLIRVVNALIRPVKALTAGKPPSCGFVKFVNEKSLVHIRGGG